VDDNTKHGLISRGNRNSSSHVVISGSILAGNVQKCSRIAVELNVRTVLDIIKNGKHKMYDGIG